MKQIKPYVFIVDDDVSVRRALRRLIASAELNVEAFSSAATFLDSVPRDTRGCVVLDIRMPGMDGFELQRVLNEARSSLAVVFVTAHAQPGDREYAMEHGAHGFLMKPFSDQSLLELIDSAIGKSKESK